VASLSQGRTAAAQCGLFTYKSVPVIFEPPCTLHLHLFNFLYRVRDLHPRWSTRRRAAFSCATLYQHVLNNQLFCVFL